MKKLALITSLILSQYVFSQITRFVYQVSMTPDSTKLEDKKLENAFLDVDGQKSVFYSENRIKRDSIMERMRATKTFDRSQMQDLRSNINYIVEKDLTQQNLIYKDRLGRDQYSYSEMPNFSWKILPQTTKIGDYNTQKAEMQYGGRTWYAWFTQEIPLQDGPYKFSGLPGLIVKIEDSKGQYSFDLMQTKKITAIITPESRGQYINLTKEKYLSMEKKYQQDPSSFNSGNMPRLGSGNGQGRGNAQVDPKQMQAMQKKMMDDIKSRNNPIEYAK